VRNILNRFCWLPLSWSRPIHPDRFIYRVSNKRITAAIIRTVCLKPCLRERILPPLPHILASYHRPSGCAQSLRLQRKVSMASMNSANRITRPPRSASRSNNLESHYYRDSTPAPQLALVKIAQGALIPKSVFKLAESSQCASKNHVFDAHFIFLAPSRLVSGVYSHSKDCILHCLKFYIP